MEELTSTEKRKALRALFLTIIIVPLILIGGYFLFSTYVMHHFANSFGTTIKKSWEQKSAARAKKDIELLYTGLLNQAQKCTYTGQLTSNDSTMTSSLQIKALDSFSLSYRMEYLINWKKEKDLSGIARLDTSWLGCQTCYFKDVKGKPRLAFRFMDEQTDCKVEILVAKDNPLFQSVAVAKETCNGEVQMETPVLDFK